ncbi:MAG: FUSC family protein [Actinomycetota bacterium]
MRERRRPVWLTDAIRLVPDRTGWRGGVRSAVQMVSPLVVGAVVDAGSGVMVVALVALNVGIADPGGAYESRFRSLMTTGVLSCLAAGVATLFADQAAALLVATVAVAVGVAFASGLGSSGSRIALLAAIVWTIFAFGDLPDPDVVDRVALTAVGAVWAMVVALWSWPLRAAQPAENAVADAWTALADYCRQPHDDALRDARVRIGVAASTVAATRSAPSILSGQIRAVDFVLTAAADVVHRAPSDPRSAHWLETIGAVGRDPSVHGLTTAAAELDEQGAPPSVVGLMSDAQHSVGAPVPITVPPWSLSRRITDTAVRFIHPGLRQQRYAFRLALAIVIAGSVALWAGLDRSYWVPLTVFIILAPTATATISKGIQRTVGTIVGVAVGIGVVGVVPPGSLWHYGFLAIVAIVIGSVMPINYGVAVIFISTAIVALMSWPNGGGEPVAAARLLDTVIGAAIAVLVGVFVWPHHPRDELDGALAAAMRRTSGYVDTVTREDSTDGEIAHARRRALAALGDASALVAEANADWSCPPLYPQEQLVEATNEVGRSASRLATRVRDDVVVSLPTAAERGRLVELLTDGADVLEHGYHRDGSRPPSGSIGELTAPCVRAYQLALAIAQHTDV